MNHYEIAVQRWPLPWMSRFQVVDHSWNDDETRLLLVLPSGDSLQFPRMERRRVRVFANYKSFKLWQAEKARAEYELQVQLKPQVQEQPPVTEQVPELQPSEAT